MSSSAPASNLKRKRDGDEDFAISTIRHRDDLLARAEAKVAPHELANDASILVVGPSGAARSRISSALSACSGRHRKLDLSVRTCEKLPLEIDFTSRLERQKKSKRVDADQQREWEEARSRLGADLVVFVLDVTSSRAFDALRESVGCISPEFWELRCFVLKVNAGNPTAWAFEAAALDDFVAEHSMFNCFEVQLRDDADVERMADRVAKYVSTLEFSPVPNVEAILHAIAF